MQVIPAIDIKDGKCVRLFQGDFDQRTEYSNDPAIIARKFQAMGFSSLHIVDLDGAQSGQQRNRDIVSAIAAETKLTIQVGGGVRDAATISNWLDKGVSRCIVGSVAVANPDLVREWCCEFGGDRVVLALDVRIDGNKMPRLTTHGWTTSSEMTLWQYLDDYLAIGPQHVLCTDVSRDGAMTGPNLDLYQEIVSRYPTIRLQASGGVRNVADLGRLRVIGAQAAITGRALLDMKITEAEVRSFQRDE